MITKVPSSSGDGFFSPEIIYSSYMSDSGSSESDDFSLESIDFDGEFTEYLWMENEEEFEKEVLQKLEEEELTEQCLEAMLEDEREIRNIRNAMESNINYPPGSLPQQLQSLRVLDPLVVSMSSLNPDAAEFVPTQVTLPIMSPTT
ncbi:polyadenylate-binding protein-interacting protein 2B [Neocloeon triangulifer]|uniref:polyadenylate-binding protein-interacting protein 2B n=1 Tax=Neocloeon triangulifer TaxID=2078957 RepID=UPI00286F1812|nr:polyadenylate-binding protein-interacting protein 2B [Neocloeon triangulifer]